MEICTFKVNIRATSMPANTRIRMMVKEEAFHVDQLL